MSPLNIPREAQLEVNSRYHGVLLTSNKRSDTIKLLNALVHENDS